MVIEPLKEMKGGSERFVAIDNIGAGIGETVLVAMGSAARVGMENAPVDAAIVGIVRTIARVAVVSAAAMRFFMLVTCFSS